MRVIGKFSKLERALRIKEDDLEMIRGVAVECANLQAQVASLWHELELSSVKANHLSGELIKKMEELEKVEEARMATLARVAALEEVIRVLKTEKVSEVEEVVFRSKA